MEYFRAFAVHFAGLVLCLTGVTGFVAALFGDVCFQTERGFFCFGSTPGRRKLKGIASVLSLLAGAGVLLLAAREFRPPSYAALLLASLASFAIVALAFKFVTRSVGASESPLAKGLLVLVNGLILGSLGAAALDLGGYFWRLLP